jgi:hypothetical protein
MPYPSLLCEPIQGQQSFSAPALNQSVRGLACNPDPAGLGLFFMHAREQKDVGRISLGDRRRMKVTPQPEQVSPIAPTDYLTWVRLISCTTGSGFASFLRYAATNVTTVCTAETKNTTAETAFTAA